VHYLQAPSLCYHSHLSSLPLPARALYSLSAIIFQKHPVLDMFLSPLPLRVSTVRHQLM